MINPSELLNDYLKGNLKTGRYQDIARYFVAYFVELPEKKLTAVAEDCHTSTTSVIRFCRELGFNDYTDFKTAVQKTLIEKDVLPTRKAIIQREQTSVEFELSITNWMETVKVQSMKGVLSVDIPKVDVLSQDIMKYRYVYLFGSSLSTLIGSYLRMQLVTLNKNIITLSVPDTEVPLSLSKTDTLGIVLTQHGRYLESYPQILPYLRNYCDKTWLITQDQPHRKHKNNFDSVLYVSSGKELLVEYHVMLVVSEIIAEYCRINA